MKTEKLIIDSILETLVEGGFFDNEWIDEAKFRPRFRKSALTIVEKDLGTSFEKLFDLAEQISKEIILENIDSTMGSLMDKGLVESVTTKDGEQGYRLNQNTNTNT